MRVGSSATPVLALAALVLALGPGRGAADEVVRVSGTGSALGAIRQVVAAFQARHPGVTIRILPSIGSGGAIRAVADGALDLGISGRPLLPGERARGLSGWVYARTPFVFAVGPRVAATTITPGELARIYRGELATWPDGERVRLVMRPRSDVDTVFVRSISPELDAAMEVALGREGLLLAATNQDCNDALALTPGSIGPSTLSQLLTEAHPLRALAWNGVVPTVPNLVGGSYPLVKELFLVTGPAPSPALRRFVAFLGSAEARRILERTGNQPVPLTTEPTRP